MKNNQINRVLYYFLLLAVLFLGFAGCESIEFMDLKHQVLGDVNVKVTNDGLLVTNFSESGKDGIATKIENSHSWRAEMNLVLNKDAIVKFNAFDERDKSLLDMTLKIADSIFLISSSLESKSFDLELYDNDKLVYQLIDFGNTSRSSATNDYWIQSLCLFAGGHLPDCVWFSEFRLNPSYLYEFAVIGNDNFTLNTPDALYSGNKLKFVENKNEKKGEQLNFEKITITGTGIETLTIVDEKVGIK